MARVTIEDCVERIQNRFLLVQAAVRRTRQLMEGSKPLVHAKNRPSVIALREIASEKIRPVVDPSRPPEPPSRVSEPREEELMLETAIEEVGIGEVFHGGGSLSELTEVEGLPEEGFHEILADEKEGEEEEGEEEE